MKNQRIVVIFLASIVAGVTARVVRRSSEDDSGSSEEDAFAEFLEPIALLCLGKTGSNETYAQVLATGTQMKECVRRELDVNGLVDELPNLDEHNRVQFFTKYCPQLRSASNCSAPFNIEVRKCLDAGKADFLDIMTSIHPEAIELICRDNGEIVFDSNLLECVPKLSGYIDVCIDQLPPNATLSMDLPSFGPEQCEGLGQLRECFKARFQECNSPRMIELFDLFYRPVVKASPCKILAQLDELPRENENATR